MLLAHEMRQVFSYLGIIHEAWKYSYSVVENPTVLLLPVKFSVHRVYDIRLSRGEPNELGMWEVLVKRPTLKSYHTTSKKRPIALVSEPNIRKRCPFSVERSYMMGTSTILGNWGIL